MSNGTAMIARDAKGLWLKGQSGNPEGGRIVVSRRRVALAVEDILATQAEGQGPDEEPECITTIAENFVEGLKNPDGLPGIGRLAWERWWPVMKGAHEQPASDPASVSSAEQWDAIAERAGGDVPAVADLALVEPEPGPVEGTD